MKHLKHLFLLALLLCLALCLVSCGGEEEEVEFIDTPYKDTTLYVYNWGEYISDGSEGSLDVIELFEKTYGITVKYETYDSNETLYGQIKMGAKYDVIIPSDYMIERMIGDGLLQPLNFDLLSNKGNILEQYTDAEKNTYDPTNTYSVPYSVGMIGIVYNTKLVDPKDVEKQSWDLLWNPNYESGQLINFNNSRDAFGVSMLRLGMNINSTERSDWDRAFNELEKQYNQGCIYLMDEVFNKMESGAAAAAAYYAGDCITMMSVNPDLAFYYPTEGTNVFVDAMCIPTAAQNVGAAHLFIDFMLRADVATQNANYISYASPNKEVLTHPDYEYTEGTDGYKILYEIPESYTENSAQKMQYYRHLDDVTMEYFTKELWPKLGISGEEGELEYGTIIFLGLLCCGAGAVAYSYGKKAYTYAKKRKK